MEFKNGEVVTKTNISPETKNAVDEISSRPERIQRWDTTHQKIDTTKPDDSTQIIELMKFGYPGNIKDLVPNFNPADWVVTRAKGLETYNKDQVIHWITLQKPGDPSTTVEFRKFYIDTKKGDDREMVEKLTKDPGLQKAHHPVYDIRVKTNLSDTEVSARLITVGLTGEERKALHVKPGEPNMALLYSDLELNSLNKRNNDIRVTESEYALDQNIKRPETNPTASNKLNEIGIVTRNQFQELLARDVVRSILSRKKTTK